MAFYKWNLNDPLQLNKYGIPEPERKKKVKPNIFLIPLVAFDKELNRLGYGGGYYDKTFERFAKLRHSFISVAVAFDDQKVDKIIKNKYDQKIDYILTEKKIYIPK